MARRVFNRHIGKDVPSEDDIIDMFISEGVKPIEAVHRARIIHREMNRLSKQEERLWKKVRTNELSSGLYPTKEID
jgi:hypothetical protein